MVDQVQIIRPVVFIYKEGIMSIDIAEDPALGN
jgi:hypothetical protein